MQHFCCGKAAFFKYFRLHLDFTFKNIFALCLDWVLKNQDWIWIAKYDIPLITDVKSKWSPKYLQNTAFPQQKCCISFPLTQSKSGPVPEFWRDLQSGSNPNLTKFAIFQIQFNPSPVLCSSLFGVMTQKPEKILPKILNEWLCNVQLLPRVWILKISTKAFSISLSVSGSRLKLVFWYPYPVANYIQPANRIVVISAGYQRWADCEIFQSESSPDPIYLNQIQSWSAKVFEITTPIQSRSANVKSCILRQNNYWSYFAFSQIWLVNGKIVPAVLLPHVTKYTQPFGISKI